MPLTEIKDSLIKHLAKHMCTYDAQDLVLDILEAQTNAYLEAIEKMREITIYHKDTETEEIVVNKEQVLKILKALLEGKEL